jgi:quinol monooxygenase YgiN
MYCIIVTNRVELGREQEYLEIMRANARASYEQELGCIQFDVVADRDQPQTFHLYEIYESEQALASHKETSHYRLSREKLAGIVVEQSVIRCDVIETCATKLN